MVIYLCLIFLVIRRTVRTLTAKDDDDDDDGDAGNEDLQVLCTITLHLRTV